MKLCLKNLRRSIFFMSIEVGSKLQGKVTGITNFGAFVQLEDGPTGLVHISEVADNYVKDINDHLKVGEEIKVKVINVQKDGKIGLSINHLRSEEHTSELQSRFDLVCRLLLEKKKNKTER